MDSRRVTVVAHELRGFLPCGGMGTATTFLALALARMGHSVEFLLGLDTPDIDAHWSGVYRDAGIQIRRVPLKECVEPWPFIHTHAVERGLAADPPDVVIAHDLGGPAYSALRLRQAGVAFENTTFVVYCHGTRQWVAEMSKRLTLPDLQNVLAVNVHERLALELADVVVSPSAYLVDWMRERAYELPERTLVIPYFTQSAATGKSITPPERERAEGITRLAFFGRWEEKKGLKLFVDALNTLEPLLLDGIEVDFVGRHTGTWTRGSVEALLSPETREALHALEFETELDQPQALAYLSRPGTLAVMPSLGDNSPNTIYECLERGIPFLASDVGGIPELVAPDDRDRVLFEPTAEGIGAVLQRALSERCVPAPARPAHSGDSAFERWANVIQMRAQRRPNAGGEEEVDVVVVRRSSEADPRCLPALEQQSYSNFTITVDTARERGLKAGSARFVVFLDEDDVPEPDLLRTLVEAQRRSAADVVTCGLNLVGDDGESTLHFFTGAPGGLGALSNDYGTVGFYRRDVLDSLTTAWPPEADPDWPLLARLAVSGARIVSVPLALVTRRARPGSAERDSDDALLVAMEFERVLPGALRLTGRLAASLAANGPASGPARPNLANRALRRLTRGGR